MPNVPLWLGGDSVAYQIAAAMGLQPGVNLPAGVDCSSPGSGPAAGSIDGTKWADTHLARRICDGGGDPQAGDFVTVGPEGYQPQTVVLSFGGNSTIPIQGGAADGSDGIELWNTEYHKDRQAAGIVSILDDIVNATHHPSKLVVTVGIEAKWYCDADDSRGQAITWFGAGMRDNVAASVASMAPNGSNIDVRVVDLGDLKCCTADRADDCIHLSAQGAETAAARVWEQVNT